MRLRHRVELAAGSVLAVAGVALALVGGRQGGYLLALVGAVLAIAALIKDRRRRQR